MVSQHSTPEQAMQDIVSHWLALGGLASAALIHHPNESFMQNPRSLLGIFVNSMEQFSNASSAFTNNTWTAHRDRWDISSVGRNLEDVCELSSDILHEICIPCVNKIRGSGKAYQALCEELSKARDGNDIGMALTDYLNKTQALDQKNIGQLLLLFSGIGPGLQSLMQNWIGDSQRDVVNGDASQKR